MEIKIKINLEEIKRNKGNNKIPKEIGNRMVEFNCENGEFQMITQGIMIMMNFLMFILKIKIIKIIQII